MSAIFEVIADNDVIKARKFDMNTVTKIQVCSDSNGEVYLIIRDDKELFIYDGYLELTLKNTEGKE